MPKGTTKSGLVNMETLPPPPLPPEEDVLEEEDLQETLPGIAAVPVVQEEKVDPPETKKTSDNGTEDKKKKPDPKRSWGEVLILEAHSLPISTTNDKERAELWRVVEESNIQGQSSAEAEQWFVKELESDKPCILPGKFMIIRKVKTVQIEEKVIRQIKVSEVDD